MEHKDSDVDQSEFLLYLTGHYDNLVAVLTNQNVCYILQVIMIIWLLC